MCNCSSLARNTRTSFIDDGRIFGTWDFKWPQGSTIDVCFQALPKDQLDKLHGMGAAPSTFSLSDREQALVDQGPNEFGRLTRLVECLARRWLEGKPVGVELNFIHDRLLPVDPRDAEPGLDYDVLVSLANLPQDRAGRTRDATKFDRSIFLPGSELGRYAQRVNYGVPTTYLGMREFFGGTISEYFRSSEFWHWAVHEFGHVLGLPHEHQNPKIHARILEALKPEKDVQKILANALGDGNAPNPQITLDEVQEEITTAWPVAQDLRGAPLYSDFRDYSNNDPVPDDSSSIMFHIFWQRLLLKASGDELPRYFERPSGSDLQQLWSMYPLVQLAIQR